jgi:drug/metabolite transporter (DMT)-like permease
MLTAPIKLADISVRSVPYILIIGIFHTGFAYYLYFSAIKKIPAQSIAALSYIDPISAVVFSAVLLSEKMTLVQILGGILILGATIYSDSKKKSEILSDI